MIEDLTSQSSKDRLLATGGVLGALAASSCCVLPLALAATGIRGAWVGAMPQLAPYQPMFIAIAVLCIGLGFWRVYGSKQAVCEEQGCGTVGSRRMTKDALWLAATLLVVAASAEWWAQLWT